MLKFYLYHWFLVEIRLIRCEEHVWFDLPAWVQMVFYICRESKEFIDLYEHSDSDDLAHTH